MGVSFDPTPGNNSATDADTVAASADLTVSKSGPADPVVAGLNVLYTITMTNSGPSAASPVTLSDTLPAGATFVSQTARAAGRVRRRRLVQAVQSRASSRRSARAPRPSR